MRISDWSTDVCSSDLREEIQQPCCVERTKGQELRLRDMSEEKDKMEGAALWRRARPHVVARDWQPVAEDEAPDALHFAAYLDGRLHEDEAARLEARLAAEPALLDELLALREDRKSTRLTPVTNAQLVCRLLL